MSRRIEFKLVISIEDDGVYLDIEDSDEKPAVVPKYTTPLSMSVAVDPTMYESDIAYHGSEEMWYTTYKE